MALLFCAHFASGLRAGGYWPGPTVVQGAKGGGKKPPSKQTAKEGGGWMPAGFGRAGARICRSMREVEIEK